MTQDTNGRDWNEAHCAFFWEYKVEPHNAAAFEAFYGAQGKWAELFQRAQGYVRTELLRDPDDPTRYRTGDYWQSREDFLNFLRDFSEQYDALGTECTDLAVERTNAGVYLTTG
ncbi:antibiotic biosynthesis monooxygenase family protein [Hoeflea poritis]|uniref:Antibiotic biosynthesis monooxygenase n=1 Tax=Hoeflea poritis TaxID=2993659 RepID=A0ABT4VHP8_9HYPH|nr:antibiotic biosynthesis monooxygenase [Hoeflea poritis]MDA4844218.1 antibiotic biosynthesis monooxygenase [Hoeflea poritis]